MYKYLPVTSFCAPLLTCARGGRPPLPHRYAAAPWLPHRVYFTNIPTLTSASIKGPSLVTNLLTYFGLTNLIYLTIILICCIQTTFLLPINENTITHMHKAIAHTQKQ